MKYDNYASIYKSLAKISRRDMYVLSALGLIDMSIGAFELCVGSPAMAVALAVIGTVLLCQAYEIQGDLVQFEQRAQEAEEE